MADTTSTPQGASDPTDGTDEFGGKVVKVTTEMGVTGLKRSGGQITEEFLPALRGIQGQRVYLEMSENDHLVGGALLAMREVVARLDWKISAPESPTPQELAQAEFTQECLDDMSESWDVTIAEALSSLTFGWSYHEIVYKQRQGQVPDPRFRSKFNDNRIGWRKFAIRSQETLQRWEIDPSGGLRGMHQLDPNGGKELIFIPIERALLFRASERKSSPEGRSMLRSAYRPWYYRKRFEEIEAIGVERDLAGMPMAYAPEAWFTDTENSAQLDRVKDLVTKARRNEIDGGLLPSIYDEFNNQLLKFELLASPGSRQLDTTAIIQRWNTAIATSMLQDFLTLGHESVGSFALGKVKVSMWQLVVDSIAKSVAEVINQHAIPRLMRLNGWMPDRMPTLTYGNVVEEDLTVLATFVKDMVDSGVIVPDPRLEAYIRDLADLPSAVTETFDNSDDTLPKVPSPTAPAPAVAPDPTPAAPVDPAPAPTPGTV
jgi:hypothetical protein